MKNLLISEKIALIWTIPIVLLIIVGAAIYSVLKFTFAVVFVKSGTADSLAFLFARLRLFLIQHQWRQIKRNDVEFDIRN